MIFKAAHCLLLNKYYTNDMASLRHKKLIYYVLSSLIGLFRYSPYYVWGSAFYLHMRCMTSLPHREGCLGILH